MKKIVAIFCLFTFCFAHYMLPVSAATYYHYPSYSQNGQLTNVITVDNGVYVPQTQTVQTVTTTQPVQYIQVPQQYIQSVHYSPSTQYVQTQPVMTTQTTVTRHEPVIVEEKPSKGETIATVVLGTLLLGGLITAAALTDDHHHHGHRGGRHHRR